MCGDGEYVIYTALAWRNKSFGQALEFVWGDDSNVFAVRESSNTSEPRVAGGGWVSGLRVGRWGRAVESPGVETIPCLPAPRMPVTVPCTFAPHLLLSWSRGASQLQSGAH